MIISISAMPPQIGTCWSYNISALIGTQVSLHCSSYIEDEKFWIKGFINESSEYFNDTDIIVS